MAEQAQQQSEWDWWSNALAGKQQANPINEPQTGYYRTKRGRVQFYGEGQWCHLNGKPHTGDLAELWHWAMKHPVTEEDYDYHAEHGRWPDENEAVLGHNRAPVDDSIDAIIERIEDLEREAAKFIEGGAAESEEISNQASDLANTFGELEAKIIALHKVEKEPHLEAGRALDRKWFGLRDRASDLKKRLKAVVVTPWLTKAKAAADAAKVAAISAGADPATLPQQRVTAGSSKRSTALRTHYRAEIEDSAKLLDSLKDHPDVLACIQRIADAAAARKVALPGCKVISEQRAA